ncbi:Fc.00g081250.m01.CDS01 [Cosmosporella sp. VM-42]
MEAIPQDILDDIVSYLLPKDFKPKDSYQKREKALLTLATLAPLSRPFQAAVERLTFKYINIKSDELPELSKLLTPARRYFLASLTFTVTLPPYDSASALTAESPAERAANNECYSQAIHSLFQILRNWEVEDSETVTSHLALAINHPESPSDCPWPSKFAPWSAVSEQSEECIHEGRYLHSYIELFNTESLPMLQRVRRLIMLRPEGRYGHRNICPEAPMLLAFRLPNLEVIKLNIDDDEKRFPDIRRRNRDETALALRKLSLPSLKSADVHFFLRRYRNETVSPPILHDLRIPDPLSSALFDFSQNLVDFELTGAFDVSLLRPIQGLSNTPWPRLRFLDVNLHATTPSGDWYFTDRKEESPVFSSNTRSRQLSQYGHSDLHKEKFSFVKEAEVANLSPAQVFRGKVNEETLVPFIDAYAEALSVMPKLTSAAFNCEIEDDSFDDGEPGWFSIAYFAPCASAKKHPSRLICPKCNRSATRQLVTSLLDWVPNEELAVKLRGVQDAFRSEPMVEKDMVTFLKEHGEE